jgi:putative lipoprotein
MDACPAEAGRMFFSKLTELLLFGFVPLMLGIMALPDAADAEERTIQGEITYRERIALPPQAVVTVELADVSLADAAASVAKQEINAPGQVPIKFAITFDSAAIRPEAIYALQARITVDNQLWFTNDERHEIDPLSPGNVELVLKSAH